MKKVQLKTFTKKFTACVLAAAMILSTPSTALAADFSGFFSISDGTDNNSDSDTGTVSSTDSNTTILQENGKITGLVIYNSKNAIVASSDKADEINKIVMTPGNKEVLTAAILTDGELKYVTPKELNENIRWRSSNSKVAAVSAKTGSMNKCTINAKTDAIQAGSTARITASLDTDLDGQYDYELSVDIEVFEPSANDVRWDITDANKFYVKHTYRLSDYLSINGRLLGDATTDVVTFAVKGSSKIATINGDILTAKKEGNITLLAVLPGSDTEPVEQEITISAGSPVKKMTPFESNKVELDFNQEGVAVDHPFQPVSLEVITTDGAEKTTDIITWTSNNESVATVTWDPDNQTEAVIMATDGIGKATITAKSTSGKTAKFNVTVKATLISIGTPYINNNSGFAWSGKTEELVIPRIPEQNKDKLKVLTSDKRVKVKSNANGVTITPANDLKLTEEEESEGGITVIIDAGPSDQNSDVDWVTDVPISVKQSNVKITDVMANDESLVKQKTIKVNPVPVFEQTCVAILDESNKYQQDLDAVSWVSGNVKVATVENGELRVFGQGTAKITASSIYKDNKGKYKQEKKTFTVKSTPMCEEIVLKSNVAAYDLSNKKQTVTINIKQQLPKKADDDIEWYVNGVKKVPSKTVTNKKITLSQSDFKGLTAGSTVEVMAVSTKNSAAYAVATIHVISRKAKKVEFATKYKKGLSMKNVGDTTVVPAPAVTEKRCNDPIVSYTVDKNGVSVVRAEMTKDGDLKLTGVGEGKATVTALTASGKKGTLKVTVAAKK